MEEWEIENTKNAPVNSVDNLTNDCWVCVSKYPTTVTWTVQTASSLPEITSMENACRWMRESTGLKIETEALITAAQDQALDTNCHKVKILHSTNNLKRRMCKEKEEAVAHIVSACSKIAGSLYKTRHNNVAAAFHHSRVGPSKCGAQCKAYERDPSE